MFNKEWIPRMTQIFFKMSHNEIPAWRLNTKAPKNENFVCLICLYENGQTSDACVKPISNYNSSLRLERLRNITFYPIFGPITSQTQTNCVTI
jgi:hypothetical protein